jgi:rare lipoprotein A
VERGPVEAPKTVPGETVGGRFLPAPVVSQGPVTGSRQIYVQAGAFTRYINATRLRDRVASIAPAQITQARVGGAQYYRVRLGPIDTVEHADTVLSRVVDAGSSDARVIVD